MAEIGTKNVEDMTLEEIQAEKDAIRRLRAGEMTAEELRGHLGLPEGGLDSIQADVAQAIAVEPEEDESAPAWPHQVIDYAGLKLEVRKPDESALVAITMTGTPGLSPQAQLRIFTKFLANHMSEDSFTTVVEAMTDPDAGVDIRSLIQALTQLPS
jgi:hypothetical protein